MFSLISFLLGYPWMALIIAVLLTHTGLSAMHMAQFGLLMISMQVAFPLIYLIWSLHVGKISDIDITKRSERFEIVTLILVGNALTLMAAWIGGTALLFQAFLGVFLAHGVTYMTTYVWKMSIHMTMTTTGVLILMTFVDMRFAVLLLLVPCVFWLRWKAHKHTPAQLLAGGMVSGGVLIGVYRYFGLL